MRNARPRSQPDDLAHKILLSDWASLHAHLVWVYDGAVSPDGRNGLVNSNHLTAWLIRRGSVKVTIGERVFCASAGQWLFPPSGKRWQSFSDQARILSVRFHASWPTGESLFQDGLPNPLRAGSHPELLRAALPLAHFVRQHFPGATNNLMQLPATFASHLRLQTIFSKWMETVVNVLISEGLLPSRMGKMDQRLLAAVRMLDIYPLTARMSEVKLAARSGLSVSQLNRLFVRQFGCSSLGYFERRRYQHGLALLNNSSKTVKEVAFDLGFSSLPHFSTWFSRRHGISPSMFRRIGIL
jgi:AraC-like DNA-binding protein